MGIYWPLIKYYNSIIRDDEYNYCRQDAALESRFSRRYEHFVTLCHNLPRRADTRGVPKSLL